MPVETRADCTSSLPAASLLCQSGLVPHLPAYAHIYQQHLAVQCGVQPLIPPHVDHVGASGMAVLWKHISIIPFSDAAFVAWIDVLRAPDTALSSL